MQRVATLRQPLNERQREARVAEPRRRLGEQPPTHRAAARSNRGSPLCASTMRIASASSRLTLGSSAAAASMSCRLPVVSAR